MHSDEPQRNALRFFRRYLISQDPFTKDEFAAATGWSGSTLATYWSKQYSAFVVRVPGAKEQFRVSEAFRPFISWRQFQRHVTQNRPVASDYKLTTRDAVVIYEFFMPLTNEAALRSTLDALFYKDIIITKLKVIGIPELAKNLPKKNGETDNAYLERVTAWIDDHFGGYSIYHVDGRFRAWKLATRAEAAVREQKGFRYLINETTAVTRFIFPCKDPAEAAIVRYFFDALFVKSIIQLINAEDEIWMVESGIFNRVHMWRITDGYDEVED
jgi:hypothetical protein